MRDAIPKCQNGNDCTIKTPYAEITNHIDFKISANDITIEAQIGTFTNYGSITLTRGNSNQSIAFNQKGHIKHFINRGTMEKMIWIANNSSGIDMLTNYGTMGGIDHNVSNTLTLNNLGTIGNIYKYDGSRQTTNLATTNGAKILIQNYKLSIDENANTFNTFNGVISLSHLVISGDGARFKDAKSKILLDFGANFEFGKEYLITKLVTDTGGNPYTTLSVDFSRLSTYNDIYTLTKSGANGFKVEITPQYGTIGTLYKSNIRTMNNFDLISNAMIYPNKYKGTNRTTRKRVIRRIKRSALLRGDSTESPKQSKPIRHTERSEVSKTHESNEITESMIDKRINELDSPLQRYDSSNFASSDLDSSLTLFAQNDESLFDSLKSNESFFYKSNSLLLANSQNTQRAKSTRTIKQNPNPNPNSAQNYYFILTPFVNHNYFFESGRYNLSGLEYGFVTAFSGKLNNNNSLGTHFVFSYANLNDKDDSVFNIKSMNLNLGLNYKLDLIYSMYLKARIDGFYFLNEVKSISIRDKI
ncbi:hypothetical protein, partial [Helicobacter sp. 23-1045]